MNREKKENRLSKAESIGSRRNSRLSSKLSNASDMLGEEKKIFDDLGKIGQEEDQLLYVNDFKRFGTNKNIKPQDTLMRVHKIERRNNLFRKGISRFDTLRIGSKSKKRKRRMMKKGLDVNKIFRKRKICRLFAFCCFTFSITIFIVMLYFLGWIRDEFTISVTKEMDFNLKNCRIFLEDCNGCKDIHINVDHRIGIEEIPGDLSMKHKTFLNKEITDSKLTYKIIQNGDIRGCNVNIGIPDSQSISKLRVNCEEKCVIIQKGKASISDLEVKGHSVYMNFQDITLGNANVFITKGQGQFNKVSFSSAGSYFFEVGHGDIIFQTSQTLSLKFKTASNNYCLSSKSSEVVTAVAKTTISESLSFYRSQDHIRENLFGNEWNGEIKICDSSCDGAINVEVVNFEGNIYANIMTEIPGIALNSTENLFKSENYNQWFDVGFFAKEKIKLIFTETDQKSLPNLILKINLGNHDAWGVQSETWVFTEHNLYSVAKPWWLSVFTLTRLVENTRSVDTFLTPGVCPFKHIYNIQDMYNSQKALTTNIPKEGILSFVHSTDDDLHPSPKKTSDGFKRFNQSPNFSDEWISVIRDGGDNLKYFIWNLTDNYEIFYVLWGSIVFCCGATFYLTAYFYRWIMNLQRFILNKILHINLYWKIYQKISFSRNGFNESFIDGEEAANFKKQQADLILSQGNISLLTLSSAMSFIDFCLTEVLRTKSASLERFLDLVFEETDHDELIDDELQSINKVKISMKAFQSLYHQFCLMNNYKEAHLNLDEAKEKIKQRGFFVTSSEVHSTFYLIRISFKDKAEVNLNLVDIEKKSSLTIFIENYCNFTEFDEDKIAFDGFMQQYDLFCRMNHLDKILIDHILLKNEYDIEFKRIVKEMIERDPYYNPSAPLKYKNSKCKRFFLRCFHALGRKKKYYNFNPKKLERINLFLAGNLSSKDTPKNEYIKIVSWAILFKNWKWFDFLAVMLEILIKMILTIPFLSIFIFQEIEHSIYSIRDEKISVYGFNISTNDIWLVPMKIFNNTVLTIFVILFLGFWVFSIFFIIYDAVHLEFPWIKQFKPTKRLKFRNFVSAYQWCFIMASIFSICAYISCVIIWDILASTIKPDAYIVSTSMAISLLFLVFALKTQFIKIEVVAGNSFNKIYKMMWEDKIRLISKKMKKSSVIENLEKNENKAYEEGEGLEFSLQEKKKITRLSMRRFIQDQPSSKPLIDFLFSFLGKDKVNQKENFEIFCSSPPLLLHDYMIQLIGNVMFQTVSMKNDRFNVEKNIRLVSSLIFHYSENELVPISLKEISTLKSCGCDEKTLIDQSGYCEGCKQNGNLMNYESRDLRKKIMKIKISENAKIMVYMLEILSNLQKRSTNSVIKIIEKTFLESYSTGAFERVKPIFDLINLIVFNLVEKFDYNRLSEIFLDFMKYSMRSNLYLTEILMIYMLRDDILMTSDIGEVYDSLSITNLLKRQICSVGSSTKERKMLVKYLSLASTFYSKEHEISENLIMEFTSAINLEFKAIVKVPVSLIYCLLHIPMYFRYKPYETVEKIKRHAKDYRIPADLSIFLLYFKFIAKNVDVIIQQNLIPHRTVKKSSIYGKIQNFFSVSSTELLGLIYLMKGNTSNKEFQKILHLALRKNNLVNYFNFVNDMVVLTQFNDKSKLKKTFKTFYKYLRSEEMYTKILSMFLHLRMPAEKEKKFSNKNNILFSDIYDAFPTKKGEGGDSLERRMKNLFVMSVIKKDYPNFKIFKELYFKMLRKSRNMQQIDEESLTVFYLVDLCFALNFENDQTEILLKLKKFMSDLENPLLYNFLIQFLRVIDGFSVEVSNRIKERLKPTFETLGELIFERPASLMKLWNIIYSLNYNDKLEGLRFFLGEDLMNRLDLDKRLKAHLLFMNKRVEFIKNQGRFVNRYIYEYDDDNTLYFSVSCLKNSVIKGISFTSLEIVQLLFSLIKKIDKEKKINIEGINPHKIFKFYSYIFNYLVSSDTFSLSKFFDDEGEPMISQLCFCLSDSSSTLRLNSLLTQLVMNEKKSLAAIYYFYYTLVGKIKRHKVTFQTILEREINDWISIKPQFMEFIELYVYRSHENFAEKIYKIQNRILLNTNMKIEDNQNFGTKGDIISQEAIKNICILIDGEIPSIKFFASLFKLEENKLSLIYTLNCLKKDEKFEKTLEVLRLDKNIKSLMALQGINLEELCFLLKVCLNKMDYDSITEFLKHLDLDMIVPDILFNLLLIDKKVSKKVIPMRNFNKEFIVHSTIFEKLGISREMAWAFFRVLKGDFLTFKKLLGILYDDFFPQNHKKFLNIVCGLIGLKNVIIEKSDVKVDWKFGINKYSRLLKEKFTSFRKDGTKEVSLQYCQYMLHKDFSVNPLWIPMLYSEKKKIDIDQNEGGKPVDLSFQDEDIKIFSSSQIDEGENSKSLLSLMQIINLNVIMNVDETILMFIYDLALFKNILNFLYKKDLKKKMELKSMYDREVDPLRMFFTQRVAEYKEIFKNLLFFKIIPFDVEIIQNSNSENSPVAENLRIMFSKTKGAHIKKEEFNLMFNRITLKYWKNCLILNGNADEKLVEKITEVMDNPEQMSKTIFDMFVTKENLMKRSYWERKFDKVEYLDSYLDVVIDYMLEELDLLSKNLDKIFYKNYNKHGNDFIDLNIETDDSGDEGESSDMRRLDKKNYRQNEEFEWNNKTEVHVSWSDAIIQALILRFRPYVNMSSDEKSDKMSIIMYKSDLIFNILEKFMFFDRTSHSFTKFNYLNDFNLSNGVILIQKAFVKSSASLFIPELAVYLDSILEEYEFLSDTKSHTEIDVLFARIKIISKIFENDKTDFPISGIFKQFIFKQSFDKIYLHQGKLNLRFFRTNLICVKNAYQYDIKENTLQLAEQYYIPLFMAKPEMKENAKMRAKYVKGVLKRASMIKGKGNLSDIKIFDPTLISLALLEENTIYDVKMSQFQSLIDELSEVYYTKKFSSYSEKEPTKIKMFYLEMIPYYKFLNDLALGKYNVLSETKNIFSEDYELNNYQKIYEAILYLHNSRKMYDHRRLETALGILSSNLSSNVSNLEYILEFVLNSDDEANLGIFKQLDISNQTFYHMFNLHNYSEEKRIKWINEIVNGYFIQPEYVKKSMSNIINFLYLVKGPEEQQLSKEQFTVMAKGIIGEFPDEEKRKRYDLLISSTYNIIHIKEEDSKRLSSITDKQILKMYTLFENIGGSKEKVDYNLIKKANELSYNVYNGTVLTYLSRLDYKTNKDLVDKILKVNNPSLLELFKIIAWVKFKGKNRPYSEIKESLHELIKGGNLELKSSPEVTEKMKELFIFFRAFVKGNILEILKFLWNLDMKAEYTYILSNYLYSGIISGWLHEDLQDNKEAVEQMSIVLCYPLLHLIYYSLKRKSKKDNGKNFKGIELLGKLLTRILELQNKIFNMKLHKVLSYIVETEQSSDYSLDALLTGRLFKIFNEGISKHLKILIGNLEDQNIIQLFNKITHLYVFSPEFYHNQDFESSEKIQELIEGAIKLREKWLNLDMYFKSEERNLHYTKPKELLKKIKKASNQLDFTFLNPTEEDKDELKKVIFPMMMFTFLFLKRVRNQIEKNDNTSKLTLLKSSLTFVWSMCNASKSNPLDDLGFDNQIKADFLNKYTTLIFHLKIKRSNLFILNELLTFVRKYIFMVKSNNVKVVRIEGQKRNEKMRKKGTWDELLYSLRLDSFMELYDYMEDMIIGKRYSENNKENILHLVVQILSVYKEFKKNKEDVRKLIKLVQGDLNALDYYINKVFFRDDNASYALNVFRSLYKEKMELKKNQMKEIERRQKEILGFDDIDHDKLMKRAEEGQCSYKDLYLLMKGDIKKADKIPFNNLRVIIRRLGLNPTQHRIAEFISAAKQKKLQNSVGTAYLNLNTIDITEFSHVFEYIQKRIFRDTLYSLRISKKHLSVFSIVSFIIFLVNLNYISNIVTNVFGGGLLAAGLCAIIPLATIYVITRQKSSNVFGDEDSIGHIEQNFENVTNSSGEFIQ